MQKKNTTAIPISKADSSEINLDAVNPETRAFYNSSDRPDWVVSDVLHAAGSLLGWPLSIVHFVELVLIRLGEDDSFDCSHAAFGEALWPHLTEKRRTEKVSKRAATAKRLMAESGFHAVQIDSKRPSQADNGNWYRLPTKYGHRDFRRLAHAVKNAALGCDLFALPKRERRKRIRDLVDGWLKAHGCQAVVREPRQASKKSATASEGSGAGESEASERGAEVDMKGRITKVDVEVRMGAAFEALFECGQDWMSLGLRLPDFVRKQLTGCGANELRLRNAVARSNKPGLKIVAGKAEA